MTSEKEKEIPFIDARAEDRLGPLQREWSIVGPRRDSSAGLSGARTRPSLVGRGGTSRGPSQSDAGPLRQSTHLQMGSQWTRRTLRSTAEPRRGQEAHPSRVHVAPSGAGLEKEVIE